MSRTCVGVLSVSGGHGHGHGTWDMEGWGHTHKHKHYTRQSKLVGVAPLVTDPSPINSTTVTDTLAIIDISQTMVNLSFWLHRQI